MISEHDRTYAYDNLGRVRSIHWDDTLAFTYDALGRIISESDGHGVRSSAYDLAGRRTRMTWPDAFYVTYDHLVTGEMKTIREQPSGTGLVLATFAYDDLGRRTSLTRGNGTVTGYAYDAASRLSQLSANLAGTTHDLTLGFTYNPASQITSNTRSNGLYAWLGHGSGTTNSTPNGLNQITSQSGATLTWDARGNLSNDGATSYAHTAENLLITAGSAGFAYDPLGRLSGSGYTNFGFDYAGGALSSEFVYTNGQLLRRYVHGPGVDEPLVWYEGAGTSDRRFLHADERGSIVAVTNSAGSAMGLNLYDEYGRPSVNNIGRFQYTGQTWMGEAGLYYYKARWYDPRVPVFLQSDPIGYGGGMHLYGYVGGDPVNFTDPSGMAASYGCHQTSGNYCLPKGATYDDQLIIVTGTRSRQSRLSMAWDQFRNAVGGGVPSPGGDSGRLAGMDNGAVGEAQRPQNRRRGLTPREKRILMCNGATQAQVDTFSLSRGLPAGFGLNSRVDAVTLSPLAGISVAHMRNGIGEMTSSRSQYGLIAHEFAHHIQYRQGMTLASYLSEWWDSGYQDSMYETIARDFSRAVVDNWDNETCR